MQVQIERKGLAQELLGDGRRLDTQIIASKARIEVAVAASGTTVTKVYGVGGDRACVAGRALGGIGRFSSKGRYARLQRDRADRGLQRPSSAASAQPARQTASLTMRCTWPWSPGPQ